MKDQNVKEDKTLFHIILTEDHDGLVLRLYIWDGFDHDEAVLKMQQLGDYLTTFADSLVRNYNAGSFSENNEYDNNKYLH